MGCSGRLRLGSRGWEGQGGSKARDAGEVFEGSRALAGVGAGVSWKKGEASD